jgi:hypothetical protein
MSAFQARQRIETTGMPTARALKALGVPKNSGYGTSSPARVVNATAPGAPSPSTTTGGGETPAPRSQPQPTVVIDPTSKP